MTSHDQPVEAQVEQTAKAWMDAAGRRDGSALEQFLADEFTMVTNRGSLIDKDQWLENMLQRVGRDVTLPEFLDVRVQVYGDAALMTSRNILRATFDGKDWSGELYLTDVWVRRDDRWQLVRRHASNLVPGAS
jgi:ketosteroid isomerase-like protein